MLRYGRHYNSRSDLPTTVWLHLQTDRQESRNAIAHRARQEALTLVKWRQNANASQGLIYDSYRFQSLNEQHQGPVA
jgi:hypothetical protein